MSFPDTREIVDRAVESFNALTTRVAQYDQLARTLEAQAVAARNEATAAINAANELGVERDALRTEVEDLRGQVRVLEAKLETYDAHPDVKASRSERLKKQREAIDLELERIKPK